MAVSKLWPVKVRLGQVIDYAANPDKTTNVKSKCSYADYQALKDAVKDQIPPMDMEMVRQKREQAFQKSPGNAYAIYQLKHDNAAVDLRFMNSEWLQKKGIEPQYENYEQVYTGAST